MLSFTKLSLSNNTLSFAPNADPAAPASAGASPSHKLPGACLALALLFYFAATPDQAFACACGCGVFEVGDFSMFPEGGKGNGLVFLDWDFQDQNHNFNGSSRGAAANNSDKGLSSHFVNMGIQYMFDRRFGLQVEAPYVFRSFTSVGGATGDQVITRKWNQFGDLRVSGIYTGLLKDQSLGFTLGIKFPTGNYQHTEEGIGIDRDTQIGTGSTDLLAGAFYHHPVTSDGTWWVFAQANLDIPVFSQGGYFPGLEADQALGVYYNGWSLGRAKIRPIGQLIASERARDSGPHAANPVASGYERLLVAPGIEVDLHPVMVDFNVEFPVWQYVTGDQLVSQALFKVSLNYRF